MNPLVIHFWYSGLLRFVWWEWSNFLGFKLIEGIKDPILLLFVLPQPFG